MSSSSFNKKNLLVAGFTLALLLIVACAAVCDSRTGIMCTSDEMCVAICLQRGGGNTGGYCSTEHVVGDPSCVCTKPCAAQSTTEKRPAAAGRMGIAN